MGRNKPRTRLKKSGHLRASICPHCGYLNCDSLHGFIKTPYIRKLEHRKANGLCIGCGHKPCTCKNKGRK